MPLATWTATSRATPFPFVGLSIVGSADRQKLVSRRLGSLAARLVVDGAGTDNYTSWVHTLDAHFPGELGSLNHSRRFAETFTRGLLVTARGLMVRMLHTKLRALGRPSDYARVIDGLTLHSGESLLIHLVVTFARDGRVIVTLLDLAPQG